MGRKEFEGKFFLGFKENGFAVNTMCGILLSLLLLIIIKCDDYGYYYSTVKP